MPPFFWSNEGLNWKFSWQHFARTRMRCLARFCTFLLHEKNTPALFPSTRPIRRKVMAGTVSSERPCDGTVEPFTFGAFWGFCVMSMVGTVTVTAMNRRQGDGRPADGSARRMWKWIDGGKVTARELEEEKEREQERRREVNWSAVSVSEGLDVSPSINIWNYSFPLPSLSGSLSVSSNSIEQMAVDVLNS